MHILFLIGKFLPEVNALASRTYENCQRWIKAYHKVTVKTCTPNLLKGICHQNIVVPAREG